MKKQLRPHQIRTIERVRSALYKGKKRIVIVMPTGSGKSLVCASASGTHAAKGGKVLWMTHREELISQAYDTLTEQGLLCGVIRAGDSRANPYRAIQVASVQTLLARDQRPEATMVVWDECFPAGTLVDGRPIETIAIGDYVQSFNEYTGEVGLKRVTGTMKRIAASLVDVTLVNHSITCTPNHPFWTTAGWKRAEELGEFNLVWTQSGKFEPVISVDRYEPAIPIVYNLEVEDWHTYFANGLAVHNCHHAVSDEWRKLLAAYPNAIILGATATPCRSDGRGLDEFFEELVVGATVQELTELGLLAPCEIVRPAGPIKSSEIAQRPVDAYLEHARGEKAVCFAMHTKAAEEFVRDFKAAGVSAEFVSYETPNRADLMRDHKLGKFQVLVNLNIATEGYDDPSVSCCILARTCGHIGLYLQIIGRVLRPYPGKQRAILLDLNGQFHIHGPPDQPLEYSLSGEGIRRKNNPAKQRLCAVCKSPIQPGSSICGECMRLPPEMLPPRVLNEKLAKFAWVRSNHNEAQRKQNYIKWALDALAKGHSIGKAFYRFRGVYGVDPGWEWRFEAERLHRESLPEGDEPFGQED